jgi:hypothetical protein
MEQVEIFKVLSVTKEWSTHTNTVVKKARQLLFPLRRLKIFTTGLHIPKSLTAAPLRAS